MTTPLYRPALTVVLEDVAQKIIAKHSIGQCWLPEDPELNLAGRWLCTHLEDAEVVREYLSRGVSGG